MQQAARTSMDKSGARLDRLYDRIARRVPVLAGFLAWVRKPSARLVRVPVGILSVLGGVLSFLPVLGIWMLPLGFLVLAVDIPPLRKPVGDWLVRGQRGLANLRRRFRRS